ncbi:MAG: serine protease [candidate division KSB1 bacterium]|nr:serine protease [candidate division KSB1 bacterium]MDZ7273072.1 serine protease [candidate division KSB1 bacterium]MDZ7285175.1 serine protease [candidate division KSB1 bacterium]MDZ7298207.1 serine protease [candidate division KSB1 bacterium]MDZ7306881.1 serine protease [candidate division KSB1 bacterium]
MMKCHGKVRQCFRRAGRVLWLLLPALALCHCSSGISSRAIQPEHILSSREVQKFLDAVVPSIVGVGAIFNYRLETYNHEMSAGRFLPDSSSPTGYRLQAGTAVSRSEQTERINGAGLVLHRDEQHTLILTCAHVVLHADTIKTYYRDSAGRRTDILHSRAILRRQEFYVLNQSNHLISAERLTADEHADLALLHVSSSFAVGSPFPFEVGYEEPLAWGDYCYLFGYPRETKQLTSGLVSLLPREDFFMIDAVARSGFSGGPVFVMRPARGLQLTGIIRGVASEKLYYVAPPENALVGQSLTPRELEQSSAQELNLIHYGAAYAVGPQLIGKFLTGAKPVLARLGIYLAKKYLPD